MARLIVKSPFIKCGDGGGAGGYLKYIATRERVQIIADDRPPTRRQEQLIRHLLHDFPDVKELDEYESYEAAHTKRAASALISMALEMNWPMANQSEIYMKYIATRPRAERLGEHGLFGDEDGVDLEKAMAELENYQGNVWTHIISLKREDAVRLGYDNANVWRDLIRTHRNEIAAAMRISPDDFRWYAAFHDEGDHPHIHMMAWSVKPGQAYLSKEGIRKIKFELTNDIFRQEMLHIYEQKSESRDELVRQARREMKKRRPIGWPRVPVREITMLNISWIIRIGHPRYCSRSPVCSITSELFSETTFRPGPAPARCPLTVSCGGRSRRRRSPWATSRMTTRSKTTPAHLCDPTQNLRH